MSKKETNPEAVEQPITPNTTKDKEFYFFPNVGVAEPFSVEARTGEEAQAANDEYIKQYKKESK